jgi:hypothetical protein
LHPQEELSIGLRAQLKRDLPHLDCFRINSRLCWTRRCGRKPDNRNLSELLTGLIEDREIPAAKGALVQREDPRFKLHLNTPRAAWLLTHGPASKALHWRSDSGRVRLHNKVIPRAGEPEIKAAVCVRATDVQHATWRGAKARQRPKIHGDHLGSRARLACRPQSNAVEASPNTRCTCCSMHRESHTCFALSDHVRSSSHAAMVPVRRSHQAVPLLRPCDAAQEYM